MCESFRQILRSRNKADIELGINILRARYFKDKLRDDEREILKCIQDFLLGFPYRTSLSLELERFEEELYEHL